MPTNKDYGQTLATLALRTAHLTDSEISEITGIDLSNIHIERLKFCLSIYQLASFVWHLNALGHLLGKSEQVNNIIDNMFSHFTTVIDDMFDVKHPLISNYIVDKEELSIAANKGFRPETVTNFLGLLHIVCDRRIEQYLQAFTDYFLDKIPQSMGPATRVFLIHYGGENVEKGVELVLFGIVLSKMHQYNLEIVQNILN